MTRIPRGLLAGGFLAAALLGVACLPGRLAGQDAPVETDRLRLDLGGYLRSLTGVHDAGYRVPGGDARSAFNSEVARLKWEARWGDALVLDVHQRVQARISTSADGFGGSVAGLGVSAVPERAVDLASVWIDDERLRVWHDVDRLALSVYTPVADVTAGRQAITWGEAALFPVADLWSQFSPFELDTEEKPGVDAVRVLAYPGSGLEVDAVVADLGTRDDVSAGVRATLGLPDADVYAGLGRLWNEALLMGGVSWILETTKLRLEGVFSRDLDAGRWRDPRITAGVDWLGPRLTLTGEYHFNGPGVSGPDGYLERLRGEAFARGESYFLGRHYVGGLASWGVDQAERLRLSASALLNLRDPSLAFSPSLTRDLGSAADLSLGALLTWGEVPAFPAAGLPRLQSEYGTYGDLAYTRFSVYF